MSGQTCLDELKLEIKSDLINHYGSIRTTIESESQYLAHVFNRKRESPKYKIARQVETEIDELKQKLINKINEICDENVENINEYFSNNLPTSSSFSLDKIKKSALKRYLVHLKCDELKSMWKNRLLYAKLGILFEYKCYPNNNQLKYLRANLCKENDANETLGDYSYNREIVLDEMCLHLHYPNQFDLIDCILAIDHESIQKQAHSFEQITNKSKLIGSIDTCAFHNISLNNLLRLSFVECIIESLKSCCFYGLDSLRELNFVDSFIGCIEPMAFAYLTSLECLRLSNNSNMKVVKSSFFADLSNLKYLYLAELNLDKIESNAFLGLNNLRKLSLNSIRIKRLESNAFEGLENMNELEMRLVDINEFENSESNPFSSLLNLNKLTIDQQSLKHLPAALSMLKEMKLHLNEEPKFANTSFDDSLVCLDLSFNSNLKQISNCFLHASEEVLFTHLRHLDLSNCQIESIGERSFDKLTNLEELYLNNNKLSGQNFDIIFIKLANLKKLDASFNQIKSINKDFFVGLNNLVYLRLVECQIELVDLNAFKNLPNLQTLKMAENEILSTSDKLDQFHREIKKVLSNLSNFNIRC